jgi:cation diffusion facilitator CzcD-associated flavoprotein CzcO
LDSPQPATGASVVSPTADVDIVIVGAGILGLYQLYRAQRDGYSVALLEQGTGVGGTWFWNRYPGCRFDSESYTYAYLFSDELFREWQWSEHFAGQPETERYLNHVVDKYQLRRFIRFSSKVTSAVYDDTAASWTVTSDDGYEVRARYLISTTGVLSLPSYPDVPGRRDFKGESYHTGLWPATPVSFTGKRVAIVGTGSSGVQIAPVIADDVASLTVYQRTPTWCTPLNNRPISADEQVALRANFEQMCETLNTSISGFLHEAHDRGTFEDSREERWAFFETMWNSPGFSKLTSNYKDIMMDKTANAEWCEFLTEKIRGIVEDPETAATLTPDHGYGGLRPPYVTDYYEMFNKPNVSLVSLRDTPMLRVTETGIETADGLTDFDMIIWATGFDFGTGSLLQMGIRGTDGLALNSFWADGPSTFLGIMCHGFPNFFFPGGPHGAAGNNPRYGGDQCDFVGDLIDYARDHDYRRIEVPAANEDAWDTMVDKYRAYSSFIEHGQYYGENISGKPRRFLLNPAGRPKLHEMMNDVIAKDYDGFLS